MRAKEIVRGEGRPQQREEGRKAYADDFGSVFHVRIPSGRIVGGIEKPVPREQLLSSARMIVLDLSQGTVVMRG
jgi:hypothetical protein